MMGVEYIMDNKIEALLATTIEHWNRMLNPNVESLSDEFMSSFYELTDAVRDWVNQLEPRPATLKELLELPLIAQIQAQLPSELLLNFTTEAELILENKSRMDG